MGCLTKENCWLNELFVNRYRIVQLLLRRKGLHLILESSILVKRLRMFNKKGKVKKWTPQYKAHFYSFLSKKRVLY